MKRIKKWIVTAIAALTVGCCAVGMSACGTEEHVHTWGAPVTTNATCDENGSIVKTCECGSTNTTVIPSFGHVYSQGKCTRCGEIDANWKEETPKEEGPVVSHTHTFGEKKLVQEATCTSGSVYVSECTDKDCDAVQQFIADDWLGHAFRKYAGQTETCLEIGWLAYEVCDRCGYSTYTELPALGHDIVAYEGKEETCVSDGWKEYEACTRCDLTTFEKIPAFGHDYKNGVCVTCGDTNHPEIWDEGTVTLEPTCVAAGIKEYVCECGAIKEEVIEPLGHDKIACDGQAVTCLNIGWNAYEYCTRCDYTTYAEIPALGHKTVSMVANAPTCENIGWNAYEYCDRCDYTTYVEIPALGHKTVSMVANAPTCENIGWEAYEYCTRCDYTTYEEIPALGHDIVTCDAQAATCENIGWNAYEYCDRCDYTTYVEIPALGHKTVSMVSNAPTCENIGWEAYEYCTRCDYTTYEEIPALGHKTIACPGKEATCLTDGYDAYEYCTRCDYTTYTVIPAFGHNWEDNVCTGCGEALFSLGLEYEASADRASYVVAGIGTCRDSNVIVPDTYDGKPVTEVKEYAFEGCTIIITVKLPDSIIKIGDKAFSGCTALIKITMPEKVEIGKDVFRGSIKVEIFIQHLLYLVEAKQATCYQAGNIEYYACSNCDKMYKDAEGEERVYDVTIPAAHNFVSGVCTKCGEVLASVKITRVDDIPYLGKFPLGTLENAIGLPAEVNVWTADGKVHSLKIQWELTNYDKSKVGTYIIEGHIQAENFIFDDGVSSKVQTSIEIVETMKGTADIVFVIDTSGSMGDEIDNVKNNIIKLAQALEQKGVSARWGLVDYSDWADVSGEDTRVITNGASNWFISVEEYKTAISGLDIRYGGDGPELAVDGLLTAMTLETRKDARTFYVLVTDANYKVNNSYGVSSMNETVDLLCKENIHVSVVTSSSYVSTYNYLVSSTGGIITSAINGDFMSVLYNDLVEKIYAEVIA